MLTATKYGERAHTTTYLGRQQICTFTRFNKPKNEGFIFKFWPSPSPFSDVTLQNPNKNPAVNNTGRRG